MLWGKVGSNGSMISSSGSSFKFPSERRGKTKKESELFVKAGKKVGKQENDYESYMSTAKDWRCQMI